MMSCKWAEFLFTAVPSRTFRDFLIRRHMERCERCQAGLIGAGEARALFVQAGDVKLTEGAYRKLAGTRDIPPPAGAGRRARSGLRWEWAVGTATLFMTAALGFWLLRGLRSGAVGEAAAARPAADRFEIDRLSVGGLPAQAHIYRLKGSDTIFIWAAKTL